MYITHTHTRQRTLHHGPRAGSKVSSEMLNQYGGWEMKCFLVVSRHVTDVSQCSEWKVQYSEKATTIPQSLHGKKPLLSRTNKKLCYSGIEKGCLFYIREIGTENLLKSQFQVVDKAWLNVKCLSLVLVLFLIDS